MMSYRAIYIFVITLLLSISSATRADEYINNDYTEESLQVLETPADKFFDELVKEFDLQEKNEPEPEAKAAIEESYISDDYTETQPDSSRTPADRFFAELVKEFEEENKGNFEEFKIEKSDDVPEMTYIYADDFRRIKPAIQNLTPINPTLYEEDRGMTPADRFFAGLVSNYVAMSEDEINELLEVEEKVAASPSTDINKPSRPILISVGGGLVLNADDFTGIAYEISPSRTAVAKLSAMTPINQNFELGMTLIGQWNGNADDYYISGAESIRAVTKYQTAAILATAKLNLGEYQNFTPYIHLNAGMSVNSMEETHMGPVYNVDYTSKLHMTPAFGGGIGVKYKLDDKFGVFVEYTYLDSGTLKTSGDEKVGNTVTDYTIKHKLRQNIILIGVEFKF